MPRWTDEQLQAITLTGKNIIVSAGAGSGKTAVLTERVIRKLKQGTSISELLILTFTKAAAKEMKERIRKAIKKDDSLKDELNKIDAAYITTFDSFALSIVKKYHYILNISSNIAITDESIIKTLKNNIIDEIFDDLYKKEDPLFLNLISTFFIKDDSELKDYIITMYNKLEMFYEKDTYLVNYLNNNFNDIKINQDIASFLELITSKIKLINNNLLEIESYVDNEYYLKLEDSLNKLINSSDYDSIVNNLQVKMPNLPKGSQEAKVYKENISNLIKDIKKICVYDNEKEIKDIIYSTKPFVKVITEILLKMNTLIKRYKEENNLYDFNDIALLALEIIKKHEDVRLEIRNGFKEILVDEYQDTNDLQEEFVSLISNNNVYMVGDIKQSIYRFRNANPYIFKNKYDTYKDGIKGIKIDLNKNFRSREEVLSNINTIFDLIMDDAIGGAFYKDSHRMIFGNTTYNMEGKTNQNNNFEIYNYLYDNKEGYTKEEIEAFIICKDIKEKIENKYQVFDKDELIVRDIKYSDFVILMDRTTNFDLYRKIFNYLNIPLNIIKDEVITLDDDIMALRNIFKMVLKIANKEYDDELKYAYVSVARSFIFKCNDNEIFNNIVNNIYLDTPLVEKIKNISSKLFALTPSMLLDEISNTFDYYNKLITIGNIENTLVRYEYLYSMAKSLEAINYTPVDFIMHLENIFKEGYDIKFSANVTSENSVKIMTIHKSKGLEYHICYYSGLYKKFNISELKEKFIYDNKYGIITPYFKEGIGQTIYKYLLKDNYIKEEISEKIRLFYVALTRAKEKMILITSLDLEQETFVNKKGLVTDEERLKYSSFNDILNSVIEIINPYITNIALDQIDLTKHYNDIKQTNFLDNLASSSEKLNIPNLNLDIKDVSKESFSKKINKLLTKEEYQNIEFGKSLHSAFENNKFKENNEQDSFISKKIDSFLNHDIFKDIEKAKIYKEYNFVYKDKDIIFNGVIDLIIEYSDKVYIIDYKLKDITDDNYQKQLMGYKKYIENKTKKQTYIYLYSILNDELKEL